MTDRIDIAEAGQSQGTPGEVFSAFFKLGLTSSADRSPILDISAMNWSRGGAG